MDTYAVGQYGDLTVVIKITNAPAYYVIAVCNSEAQAIAIAAALNG